MNFKDMLNDVKRAVDAMATAAGSLENQHLADILKDAAGRMHDAANHPDAENVDAEAVQAALHPLPQG